MCQWLQPICLKYAYIVSILRYYWFDLFDICPNQSAEHLIDEVPKKVEDKLKDLEEIAEGDAKPEWETTSQGVDQTSVPYSVVNLVLYNMLVQCAKEDVDLDQVLCWILATVAVRAGCSWLEQSIQKHPWYGFVSKTGTPPVMANAILNFHISFEPSPYVSVSSVIYGENTGQTGKRG